MRILKVSAGSNIPAVSHEPGASVRQLLAMYIFHYRVVDILQRKERYCNPNLRSPHSAQTGGHLFTINRMDDSPSGFLAELNQSALSLPVSYRHQPYATNHKFQHF